MHINRRARLKLCILPMHIITSNVSSAHILIIYCFVLNLKIKINASTAFSKLINNLRIFLRCISKLVNDGAFTRFELNIIQSG